MRILFVCTGNIFRSMAAELLLKKYFAEQGILGNEVRSAGIEAIPQVMHPAVRQALVDLGVDVSKHKQTKLSAKDLAWADLVVGMNQNHLDFMKENFGYTALLFNDICFGKKTPVLDVSEALSKNFSNLEEGEYIRKTVNYINSSIPLFVSNSKLFAKKA